MKRRLPPINESTQTFTFTRRAMVLGGVQFAFAGLLVIIMRSDEVRGILTDLVRRALTVQ